eukprot:gnl/TRDRNA2_/TRDRNA2_126162_c0_seq1.p1 gnl/TRDRNA2_/TRDRNA2_126162_c0~~gnl/TRDRNA2_/TRDRNA2_126162_c0_seq1.p1  ORF type:complete len:651 (+),score=161.62 gnl/TRDRNA2_/TRDRNA2_126162_c0_seq1:51-2003(+)
MFSLKSFAQSTFGELKDALVNDDSDEDYDEDEDDDDDDRKRSPKSPSPKAGKRRSGAASPASTGSSVKTTSPAWPPGHPNASEAGSPAWPPGHPNATTSVASHKPVNSTSAPLVPGLPALGESRDTVSATAQAPKSAAAPPQAPKPQAPSAAAPDAATAEAASGLRSTELPAVDLSGSGAKQSLSAQGQEPARLDPTPPGPAPPPGPPPSAKDSLVQGAIVADPVCAPPAASAVGAAVRPASSATSDSQRVYQEFRALLSTPGVAELLSRHAGVQECQQDGKNGDNEGDHHSSEWTAWAAAVAGSHEGVSDGVDGVPVAHIAQKCTAALRSLAPALLAKDVSNGVAGQDGSQVQRLLSSFSERYDSLMVQYTTLQERCREMARGEESEELLRQQLDAWQTAHRVASDKVETITLENADLRERLGKLEARGALDLERKLAQKDAEVRASAEALRRLQEAVEDGAVDEDRRFARLSAEKEQVASARDDALRRLADLEARLARAEAKLEAAEPERQAMLKRTDDAEREAREAHVALEELLEQKGKHLEEREHLVDRRVATGMLASALDHLEVGATAPGAAAGKAAEHLRNAERALAQVLEVFGGAPQERQRAVVTSSEASRPLADAFFEFLENELADEEGGDPATASTAKVAA